MRLTEDEVVRLPRRSLLQLMAVGGAGMVTAACADTSGGTGSSAPKASAGMVIPDPVTKLPTGTVELTWIDSGDAKAAFAKELAAAYHKKHPNITINYDGAAWNNIAQVISAGVRNGSCPDIFALPGQIPLQTAITNGWIGAFNDVIPNFDQVKKRFPPGAIVDGINTFNGKTYMMPMTGLAAFGTLLLFNEDYVKKADLDFDNKVMTWDQLRTNAKKLTQQGNGNYYGIIMGLSQPGGLTGVASSMAAMAGVPSGLNDSLSGINWLTGEYSGFSDSRSEEVIELLLAIHSDGSIHPDSISLDQPKARARFPQGQAAIIFQGPWNIPIWEQTNPDFRFGLNIPPQKDPGNVSPVSSPPGGSNSWVYYAKTKAPTVIGDIFSYWASREGQIQWADVDPAGDPPFDTDAAKDAKMDALSRKALSIGQKYTAIRPEPAVRNPDVEQVVLNLVPPAPAFADRVMAIFTGQSQQTVKQVLQASKDAAEKALDDAIAKAKAKGANVSREDFVFSDWDPRKPYTKLYEK